MTSDDTGPAERAAYLADLAAAQADRAALTLPPSSGRGLVADAAQAEEHFNKIHNAWDELDRDLAGVRATISPFPAPAEAAELAELTARRDMAWRARELALARRDHLLRQLDQLGQPGWDLPPGEGWGVR